MRVIAKEEVVDARSNLADSVQHLKHLLVEKGSDLAKTMNSVNLSSHWRNHFGLVAGGAVGAGILLGIGARRLLKVRLSEEQLKELARTISSKQSVNKPEEHFSEARPGLLTGVINLALAYPTVSQLILQTLLTTLGSKLPERKLLP